MAIINKKLIHFNTKDNFNNAYLATNANNSLFRKATGGTLVPATNALVRNNNAIKFLSIVFIKDTQEIWTHGELYNCLDFSGDIANINGDISNINNKRHAVRWTIETHENQSANVARCRYMGLSVGIESVRLKFTKVTEPNVTEVLPDGTDGSISDINQPWRTFVSEYRSGDSLTIKLGGDVINTMIIGKLNVNLVLALGFSKNGSLYILIITDLPDTVNGTYTKVPYIQLQRYSDFANDISSGYKLHPSDTYTLADRSGYFTRWNITLNSDTITGISKKIGYTQGSYLNERTEETVNLSTDNFIHFFKLAMVGDQIAIASGTGGRPGRYIIISSDFSSFIKAMAFDSTADNCAFVKITQSGSDYKFEEFYPPQMIGRHEIISMTGSPTVKTNTTSYHALYWNPRVGDSVVYDNETYLIGCVKQVGSATAIFGLMFTQNGVKRLQITKDQAGALIGRVTES